MVTNCVNPQCSDGLRSAFGAGALYALDRARAVDAPRRVAYFWLCASCAENLTVVTNPAGDPVVVAQSAGPFRAIRSTTGDLRLVFRSTSVPLPMSKNTKGWAISRAMSGGR